MAATFSDTDDLSGAEFLGTTLRGARFVETDLSGIVVRGSVVHGAEIESPWLLEGGGSLRVNGVDVVPLVDAELNRRFPGRELRGARHPDGLRAAWAALEQTWHATTARAAAMPAGTVDVSVAGEWSFAQTLRHLVLAIDMWLRKGVLGIEQPFHPIGQLDVGSGSEADVAAALDASTPSYDEVLEVRADRQAMVRDFLASVTPAALTEPRPNPHDPAHEETVLSCLHTILEEEWEHHRYAVRDLDALEAGPLT